MSFAYDCSLFHDSCLKNIISKTIQMKYTIKLYTLVHLFSAIIFKRKQLKNDTIKEVKKILTKILRSCAFMSGFVIILRASFCICSKIYKKYSVLVSIFQALIACSAIVFEESNRVVNLSLFTFPRSIESLGEVLIKREIIPSIPHFMKILFTLSLIISIIMKDKDELKGNLRSFLDFMIL